jgi:hypothetical protein
MPYDRGEVVDPLHTGLRKAVVYRVAGIPLIDLASRANLPPVISGVEIVVEGWQATAALEDRRATGRMLHGAPRVAVGVRLAKHSGSEGCVGRAQCHGRHYSRAKSAFLATS